jgi:methyl-accepting chemotaxis protein
MKISTKMFLGTTLLIVVPLIVTSGLTVESAYDHAASELTTQAYKQLVAVREAKQRHIESYIDGLVKSVQGIAQSRMAAEAMKNFLVTYKDISKENDPSSKELKSNIAKYKESLQKYYTTDFVEKYASLNAGQPPDMAKYLAELSQHAMAMQYFYISSNQNPIGQKQKLVASNDLSKYANIHSQYHKSFETIQRKLDFYDIFLIDSKTGDVVYTVFKELDFGSNVKKGIGASTGLSQVFEKVANANDPEEIAVSDFSYYLPSYNEQAGFIAAPIFQGEERIGVLVIQIPLDTISEIMSSSRQWSSIGLGSTGDSYLVGRDMLMRTNARPMVEDKDSFIEFIRGHVTSEHIQNLSKKGTTVGIQKVDISPVRRLLEQSDSTEETLGTSQSRDMVSSIGGYEKFIDYRGENVYGTASLLDLHGLKWVLVVTKDVQEVLKPLSELHNNIWFYTLLILIGVLAAASVGLSSLLRTILDPIKKLDNTVQKISGGDYTARSKIGTSDELGDLGRTFDSLLEDRISFLAKAERENEQLNNSIIEILQAVHQLSQKDLTVKAPVTADVIGTVSDSINLLTDETTKVLHQVVQIAGSVVNASERVKIQANTVSVTAEHERHELEKMLSDLSSASQSLDEVVGLAETSNKAAEEATHSTLTALESVDNTIKGMENIREAVSETEKRIKRLAERSQEIGNIVNLISTVSERTHVLALNASMQAAVAGPSGRGFAVVAEEVQRLSDSTRKATEQISALVNNIQIETNDTIVNVSSTISQVVDGSNLAVKAGQQMRATCQATESLVELVKKIAESSQYQANIARELRNRANQIGESTVDTAAKMDTQTFETEVLVKAANELIDSVSVFKLPATVV